MTDLQNNLENKLVYLKLLPETKVVDQYDEFIDPKREPSPRLGSKPEYSKRVEYEHRKREYKHVPDGWKFRTTQPLDGLQPWGL
jgi:hypothetical protein